jgi:hypothetical protein
VPAGLVAVVEPGAVDALVVGVVVPAGAVVLGVPLPFAGPTPEVPAGLGAGVGNDVNGVGSGGSGVFTTVATS